MIAEIIVLPLIRMSQPTHSQQISFSDRQSAEVELLSRFMTYEGVNNWTIRDGDVCLVCDCDASSFNRYLLRFSKEFGVNARELSAGRVQLPFPLNNISPSHPESLGLFRKHLDRCSPVRFACTELIREHHVAKGDKVLSCIYMLRPWLKSNLDLTVRAQGSLQVLVRGHTYEFAFYYPD
jgi:hypothetical protein